MEVYVTELISSSSKIIEELSYVVGEREIIPEVMLSKLKSIKDWSTITEHQKLLSRKLRRDISIHDTIIDYLLSTRFKITKSNSLDVPSSKKVFYSSIIDPITGLYNDRHFELIAEAEIKRAKQSQSTLAISVYEIDDFDTYSTFFGKETAEIALKDMALIIKKNCRKEDILFHDKKDRFVLLLLNIPREGSHRVGERIRKNVETFRFSGEEKLSSKKLTVSGGIAIYPDDGKNSQTLINAAEEAMATAKESGSNRILEFSAKRRKAPRINVEIDAKYEIEGRKDIKPQIVILKNFSESGALVVANQGLPLGNNIILSFKLPKRLSVKVKGETVRIATKESFDKMSVAIKFTDIKPQLLTDLRKYIKEAL